MEDTMLNIRYEKTTNPKEIPGEDNPLKFGTIFTDHMFIMNYETGKGWFDPRIVPYQPLKMEPSSMVFHYGQEMFEGLKAYKTKDGRTLLFRPNKNIERANNTNRRICIPEIPEEDFIQAGYDEFYDEDENELTWDDIKDLREFDGGLDFCFYESDAWSNVWEDSKMDWKIVEIQ